MNKLTKTLAALSALVVIGSAPAVADGYAKAKAAPAYAAPGCAASPFSGFYAGVHGGMGSLSSSFTAENVLSIDRTEDGYAIGGQIGYNWVKCNALFGIEADFSISDFESNQNILGGLIGPGAPTLKRSVD
jgi:hypothetical protein